MKHKPRAGAIVPYFGSKRRIADLIVGELGPHRCFWDCAHGGLSVLFAKKRSAEETVLDLNGHATNLAMVLASPRYKELYDLCARTIPAEGIYRDCCTRFRQVSELPPESPAAVTSGDVARAYDFFIASWLGRQGVGGTHRSNYQIGIRLTSNAGGGPVRFLHATEAMEWWHQRLRRVLILNRSMFDILPRIDDTRDVVIYIDPPYLKHTRGDGGGSTYAHDFKLEDHKRLASSVTSFQNARVVLSYYDDPVLDELYRAPRWNKRKLEGTYRSVGRQFGNPTGGKISTPEVLLINGPSLVENGLFA